MTDSTPLRITVISIHYYADYVGRSLEGLNALCAALKPTTRIVVSNNAEITALLRREAAGSDEEGAVIEHDNAGLEFGAYQAGLDKALSFDEPDWYVVLNDTFSVHDCFATPLRDSFARALRTARGSSLPIIAGQVDDMPRSFRLGGCRTHRWVRSNVMALNPAALRALGQRLYCPELDELIRDSPDVNEFFTVELDPVLRERIGTWLFSRDSETWGWYKAADLTPQSAARLARKARSILHEKYLSARLEDASAIFIDIKRMGFLGNVRRGFERRIFLWRYRAHR